MDALLKMLVALKFSDDLLSKAESDSLNSLASSVQTLTSVFPKMTAFSKQAVELSTRMRSNPSADLKVLAAQMGEANALQSKLSSLRRQLELSNNEFHKAATDLQTIVATP